jgi:hypothetical protein
MEGQNGAQEARALPSSMRYSLQSQDAVSSTLTMRRYDGVGGTYSPTGTNEIRIPVSAANGFLDTRKGYLHLTINNTGSAVTGLQPNAGCIIQELIITSQGVECERIQEYSHLNCIDYAWNNSTSDLCKNMAQSGGGGCCRP